MRLGVRLVMKRKALLMNIDDIPIHELHKADGY
jgi:hypothetical protein